MIILVLLYFLLSSTAKLLLGYTIINRIVGRGSLDDIATCFVLGTVVHLLGVLLLKCLHYPWIVAVSVAATPGLLSIGELRTFASRLKSVLSWDYVLWLGVVVAIGSTIMTTEGGIGSVWENNSSDLAFHLGIISSFVLGDNFPPQYTIFPGEALSYSFLINLWTAEWWWIEPVYRRLSLIFCLQWVVLWALVPRLLIPSRIAPWLILFGGGSTFNFFYTSKELIAKNVPWSVFISTIWIPQRSAMFGLVVVLAALRIYFSRDENRCGFLDGKSCLSGLLLGLSILVHAHLVASCAIFIIGLQAVKVVGKWRTDGGRNELGVSISISLGLVSAILSFPLLTGKEEMTGLMTGWVTGEMVNETSIKRIFAAICMWLQTIIPVFALMILIFRQNKYRIELTLIIAMFLFGNFVRLAVWPWDQIKFFLGIYIILIFLFSRTTFRIRLFHVVILLLLMLPAVWESSQELMAQEDHTIYSPSHIEAANQLNKLLPKRAIVVADSSAFSLVTLAGRFLYEGYDGTLWSHGIKQASILSRTYFQSDLSTLGKCMYKEKPLATCPDFLLWTNDEQEFWHRPAPPEEWRITELSWLYRRRKR